MLGDPVGDPVDKLGPSLGDSLGKTFAPFVGIKFGATLEFELGDAVEEIEGSSNDATDAEALGLPAGLLEGTSLVGLTLELDVGLPVGSSEVLTDGEKLGLLLGASLELSVGEALGLADGAGLFVGVLLGADEGK